MHFDDRLATVLRFRADGAVTSRIQLRQLLDLLGTSPSEARGPQIDAAYDLLARLATAIPATEHAAMLTEPGVRLRSPRLVAALSAVDPRVASAAIGRASLSEEQWLDLIPALPVPARGFVRQRRNLGPLVDRQLQRLGIHDRGLPPSDQPPSAQMTDEQMTDEEILPPVASATAGPEPEGIGAIVRRIEAYRRAREVIDAPRPGDAPRLPLGEDHVLHVAAQVRAFDFATDAAGRICWADPGVAPMAIGLTLAGRDFANPAQVEPALADAVRRRQPIRAGHLSIVGAPPIAGDWLAEATPWFETVGGRFAGYRGRMRRPAAALAETPRAQPDSASDRVRQLLHELRTPVNAIQGFAEIIQQQLFGQVPHEYRALAANIAGDAARMLAAFEELERLARLNSGVLELESGECDFAGVVASTIEQLAPHTGPRSSGFSARIDQTPLLAAMAQVEAERIVWRLLATLAGTAAPGELLRLRARGEQLRLTIALPASLAVRDNQALFHAAVGAVPQAISAGVFGVGFALRLATAEAKAAGGLLIRKLDRLQLILPGLTGAADGHSHTASDGSASAAAPERN